MGLLDGLLSGLKNVFEHGTLKPTRSGINFTSGAVVTDDPDNDRLNVEITGAGIPSSRTVTAGAGLTGGGDLSTDRTINVGAANSTIVVEADGIRLSPALSTTDQSITDSATLTFSSVGLCDISSSTDAAQLRCPAGEAFLGGRTFYVLADDLSDADPAHGVGFIEASKSLTIEAPVISFAANRLRDLAEPFDPTDAATKNYADDTAFAEAQAVQDNVTTVASDLDELDLFLRTKRKTAVAKDLLGAQTWTDLGAVIPVAITSSTTLANATSYVEVRVSARKQQIISGVTSHYAYGGLFRMTVATTLTGSPGPVTVEMEPSSGSSVWVLDDDPTYPIEVQAVPTANPSEWKLQFRASNETGISGITASTLSVAAYVAAYPSSY